jgi:hypothetical protein
MALGELPLGSQQVAKSRFPYVGKSGKALPVHVRNLLRMADPKLDQSLHQQGTVLAEPRSQA